MKVRKSLLLVKSPRRRCLGFVRHAFISPPRSVGERDRGGEWMRDERTPKDVCGEAIARQDQIISWVTTVEYRVKDSSWNGLNNHVSKIHLIISFRLKEILKNCVIVRLPSPTFSSTIQPEQDHCYNYQNYWGKDKTWTGGPWTPCHGPACSWTVFLQ